MGTLGISEREFVCACCSTLRLATSSQDAETIIQDFAVQLGTRTSHPQPKFFIILDYIPLQSLHTCDCCGREPYELVYVSLVYSPPNMIWGANRDPRSGSGYEGDYETSVPHELTLLT